MIRIVSASRLAQLEAAAAELSRIKLARSAAVSQGNRKRREKVLERAAELRREHNAQMEVF